MIAGMQHTATVTPSAITAVHAADALAPLSVTFAKAHEISGLGLTTLWKLARQRRIEVVRIGRRTLITYRSLSRLLLPPEPPGPPRAAAPPPSTSIP
jgi:hypothetical protein